jgi:hypothetical protein
MSTVASRDTITFTISSSYSPITFTVSFPQQIPPQNRVGNRWTPEEVQQLLDAVQAGKTNYQIAATHKRTVGAIYARLKKIAVEYYTLRKKSIYEIHRITGLTLEQIQEAINS